MIFAFFLFYKMLVNPIFCIKYFLVSKSMPFILDLRNMFLLLKSIPSGSEALIQEVQQHITKIGLDVVNSLRGDNVSCYYSKTLKVN